MYVSVNSLGMQSKWLKEKKKKKNHHQQKKPKTKQTLFCIYRESSRKGPCSTGSVLRHYGKQINNDYNFTFFPHEIPSLRAFAIIKKFMNKNPVKIK